MPQIYHSKAKLWKTDISISKWILRNLFIIFKRVFLIVAIREICGGSTPFLSIRKQAMPDEYLRFKFLLKSAFVGSFSKAMLKVLGTLMRNCRFLKSEKYFKLRNLRIGYAVKDKKSEGRKRDKKYGKKYNKNYGKKYNKNYYKKYNKNYYKKYNKKHNLLKYNKKA